MLPSSGAISLSDIAGTMGGSTPYALSNYYSGGANVPANTPPGTIPTSGTISLGNFYSAGKYRDYGTSGDVQLAFTIPNGEGGTGEGFYRVVGTWTATYGGTVYAQYYTYPTSEKVWDLQFRKVSGGTPTILAQSTGSGGSFQNPSVTFNGSVDVLPGDVLQGYCYLWGNFGSDHILGGYFNVYGTP